MFQVVIQGRLRGIAILAILSVAMDVRYVQAVEYNFDYIDDFKKEAQELVGETSKGGLSEEVKGIEGYTDKPKETEYSEYELRSKGDARVKGQEKDENEGVREAIGAAKSSYIENPHRSNYTVGKLQHKEFIKKGDAVTSNPISGLNAEGKAECKIADKDLGGENVEFEEYYVDVEDTRLIRGDKKCEEDEDRLFYCTRKIKDVKCISEVACSFDNAEGEGGLYTSASNREFASSSGGKFKWNYNQSTGELMFGNESSYSYDDADESCLTKEFTAKFFIKDKVNVSEFAMSEVFENNVMDIWVNGNLIYEGERYGIRTNRPECRATRRGGGLLMGLNIFGGNDEACWLNACQEHWRSHYKDLKNYIRDGWNEVKVKLRYTRSGHAGLKIKAKQYCCKEWSNEWEGDCPL